MKALKLKCIYIISLYIYITYKKQVVLLRTSKKIKQN